jgi:hypothetical protein
MVDIALVFLRNLHTDFQSGLINLVLTECKILSSSPTFVIFFCFLDDSCSHWGDMESQCSFDF